MKEKSDIIQKLCISVRESPLQLEYQNMTDDEILESIRSPLLFNRECLSEWPLYVPSHVRIVWSSLSSEGQLVAVIAALCSLQQAFLTL